MASSAVSSQDISRIVGYNLTAGDFRTNSPNLPQLPVIIGEANDASQGSLVLTPTAITSEQQAGALYGYGSPIHHMVRIMLPSEGGGVSGIPVVVMALAAAGGAAAALRTMTITGSATGNGTHTLYIAGRTNVKGAFYSVNILTGDTPAVIDQKYADAVNAVLGAPVIAAAIAATSGPTVAAHVNFTSKWSGLTSNELTVSVDTGNDTLGLVYAFVNTTAGSGTPSIQPALDQWGTTWYTSVVNGLGAVSAPMTALEAFNGRAVNATVLNPTGQYAGIVMRPFVAFTGSVADDPSSITDGRLNDQTIAICPAPGSKGFSFEAAANYATAFIPLAQDKPSLDIAGIALPDMPTPTSIGSMASYANRNAFLKKGCSTVDLVAGRDIVQDFVTTYHPVGETPPQYRYVRNLNIDFNTRFRFALEVESKVLGRVIVSDGAITNNPDAVSPKQVLALLFTFTDGMVRDGMWTDAQFTKNGATVAISTSNPNRFDIFFPYKRTGVGYVVATTAQAGFNFGTIN